MRNIYFNLAFGSMLVFAVAVHANAQQASPAPPAKLLVEEIQSGWLFAPDARATDLNGKTGALAGGYIGHITDRTWVIGAGGYFLTNREDDFKLAYGGPVFDWLIRSDRKIGFGVRTLVGAGTATLARPLSDFVNVRGPSRRDVRTPSRVATLNHTVAVDDDFFVAEPQLNVMVNLSKGQRLVFGVGYRAVANAPLLGDQLNGVSGSVSFQVGGK